MKRGGDSLRRERIGQTRYRARTQRSWAGKSRELLGRRPFDIMSSQTLIGTPFSMPNKVYYKCCGGWNHQIVKGYMTPCIHESIAARVSRSELVLCDHPPRIHPLSLRLGLVEGFLLVLFNLALK